jgi:hypothetical protein
VRRHRQPVPAAEAVITPPDAAPAPEQPDWITAVVPVQEESLAMTPANTDSSEPENIQVGDAVEVMRIWRDLSDGKLIIQLGSQYYRSLQ